MASTNTYSEHWLTGPQSTKFYVRTYPAQSQSEPTSPAATTAPPTTTTTSATAPKGILVFLHGFIEHIGRYSHVFPHWSSRGFHVFAFDQRGFGQTASHPTNKSPDSSYAKTSGEHQLEDAEWAVKTAKEHFSSGEQGGEELPVFVMGHSMGGGVVLDFATKTKSQIAGIIASSPLILQTTAAPKIARWVGGKVSLLTPYSTVPAQVKAEHLSKDEESNQSYLKDPLIKQKGSLKGISDMLNRGEELLQSLYKSWPEHVPLLIVHGTGDKVTSHAASQRFHDVVPARDKRISKYDDGYHELHNEPNGVKDRFIDECISWVEARLPSSSVPSPAQKEDSAAVTTAKL
ncbi:lysophospholipase [Pyrrhoderma noxium]|uniref:Lysophospholipase n=1 Tax=Pyrrhoderma noxium TaxID=2282107 RepID=A0A286U7D0_9AGAM|nr:lysophospholipase [Pyrrhoderma noxium]